MKNRLKFGLAIALTINGTASLNAIDPLGSNQPVHGTEAHGTEVDTQVAARLAPAVAVVTVANVPQTVLSTCSWTRSDEHWGIGYPDTKPTADTPKSLQPEQYCP